MTSLSTLYSKDSFDRFGDDLCEVLLSYLSFEEKFRFQYVSKQWLRLVFNKQKEIQIDLNEGVVYLCRFEKMMRKCPNITSIVFDKHCINSEVVFELIVKYCHNLTQITADFHGLTQNTINEFCHKFGSKLKKIRLFSNNETNKELLKLFLNLRTLDIKVFNDMSVLFNGTELLFTKLSDISFTYSSNDCNRIGIFCENSKNSLESIEVIVGYRLTQNELKTLFNSLTQLTKLKTLVITGFVLNGNSFVDYLRELSHKSLKLKKIVFKVISDERIELKTIFKSFNCFKRLKRLEFLININQFDIRSEALNICQNLTHLTVNSISDEFFNNIDKNLPKLQHIYCETSNVSNKAVESLSKLSDLQTIKFNPFVSCEPINQSIVLQLIRNCFKIKSISVFGHKKNLILLDEKQILILRQNV